MSMKEFLTGVLGIAVYEEQRDFVTATVVREKFADTIDELVNARGLVAGEDNGLGVNRLAGIGLTLAHLYATDDRLTQATFGVHALLHDNAHQIWFLLSTKLPEADPSYPSVTRRVTAAHVYERWLFDMFGIEAIGHPDLRRLVHHENMPVGNFPLRKDFVWNAKIEQANLDYPMPEVTGVGVCQVPIGPMQAGMIEPGHFCLNVAGERILTLESKQFFTHKGIEKLLEGKTIDTALPYVERIAGDAAGSHALAFAQAVEALANCQISQRARCIRTVICELERMTTHIHDLAAIGGLGAGYTILSAQGFRLKERLMRLSDDLIGNRFWRGLIIPGGVSRDININEMRHINIVVTDVVEEMLEVINLALGSDGFCDRLETTGVLTKDAGLAYGAVGIVARASGLDRDVRRDQPYAAYAQFIPAIAVKTAGDVHARFILRADELKDSLRLIQEIFKAPGEGEPRTVCTPLDGRALGAVEGARGEIIHLVYLRGGKFERYVIRDPSFCNSPILSAITPGNLVSDWGLCQLSVSSSYSGTDL